MVIFSSHLLVHNLQFYVHKTFLVGSINVHKNIPNYTRLYKLSTLGRKAA